MQRNRSDVRTKHSNEKVNAAWHRRRQYAKQNQKMMVIFLVLLVVFLSLLTLVIIEEIEAKDVVPGALMEATIPLPDETVAQEVPQTTDVVVPQPVVQPTVQDVPTGGWPAYTFSAEQVAQLDTVLAEWAAATQPEVEEESAETQEENETPEEIDPEEGHRVALYFRDLDSGAEYIYNGEQAFDVASLSKAPYAMYLYELVEQGQASLDETFLVDAQSIEGSEENSGVLKDDENLPREITLAEMIEYLLRYSDTAAQRILLERYPADGFAAYAAELGVPNVYSVTGDDITAPQAGSYLAALYEYMANGQYGSLLQEHLMNTRNAMITASWPIARKYGWDTHAYHDMAVVYASHPYLIAILSDKSVGAAEDTQYFSTLPAMLEQMMNEHWATVATLPVNQKQGVE